MLKTPVFYLFYSFTCINSCVPALPTLIQTNLTVTEAVTLKLYLTPRELKLPQRFARYMDESMTCNLFKAGSNRTFSLKGVRARKLTIDAISQKNVESFSANHGVRIASICLTKRKSTPAAMLCRAVVRKTKVLTLKDAHGFSLIRHEHSTLF